MRQAFVPEIGAIAFRELEVPEPTAGDAPAGRTAFRAGPFQQRVKNLRIIVRDAHKGGIDQVQLPAGGAVPGSRALVRVRECAMQFQVDVRLDSAVDVENYSNGGILPRMLALMQAGAC